MKLNSIFSRLFIYFISFTLILVGSLWASQIIFLPDYYQSKKVDIINKSIFEIDELVQKENFNENTLEKINETVEILNGRIIVYDKKGIILYEDGFPGMMREKRISQDKIERVLKEKTFVYKTNAIRGNNEFLSVLSLGKNNIYLFLTPFQEIKSAIAITRDFYLFLVLGGILISFALAYFFALKISKPLIELNNFAGDIADLNFGQRWNIERNDEIGELGNSLNKVSLNLEKNLSDLQEELDKEKNLDKMRKNFVSRVSHELQTPIAIINGHIEALGDGIPQSTQEREEYLSIIENETTKMSKLIKDLLDLTQLESGNFRIEKKAFNYLKLMKTKINTFQLLFKGKNIEIIQDFHSENIILNGDEYKIDQVLNNLLQNAINNCKDGGRIIIKTIEEKDWIKTEIYNEGEKIPEKILPFIWIAFYKGEEKKGTGIGLAVVKSIINLHGGEIGVSNKDKGVEFYFTIPKQERIS